MAADLSLLHDLEEFARTYADPALTIHDVVTRLDDDQEGEPITRVLLLLSDPASDTWDIDRVRELRQALGRRATELGLPRVSLTLVPESEAEVVEPFARR